MPWPLVPRAAVWLETAAQVDEAMSEAATLVKFHNGAARTRAVPVTQPQFNRFAQKASAYP